MLKNAKMIGFLYYKTYLYSVFCFVFSGREARKYSSVMSFKKVFLVVVAAAFVCYVSEAQNVTIKTNLLSDAALSPNVGVEIGLAPRWSVDLNGQYNLWTVNGHKWKHILAQPELRYWFCDRYMRHFVGVHAIGIKYNVGNIPNNIKFLGTDFSLLSDYRFQGWGVGGGVSYGYALPLNRRWNIEFEIGAGYVYTRNDKFECKECGKMESIGAHHYIGPTKAAINLVYLF